MHNPLENFAKTAVNLQTLYDTKSDYLNRDRYGEKHPGLQYFLVKKNKSKEEDKNLPHLLSKNFFWNQ